MELRLFLPLERELSSTGSRAMDGDCPSGRLHSKHPKLSIDLVQQRTAAPGHERYNLPVPDGNNSRPDEIWMGEALRAAQRALEAGEIPVGAIVVHENRIVGRGSNRNITDHDPTAHAEVLALREAGAALGNHRLSACQLFATIEPCAMCAGALVHARIRRLVYGADDPKAGAVHSVLHVLNHPALNHRMEVRTGVLAGSCAELLQQFFRLRR